VLDVSTVYAAPITAMLLGDFGAEVIKVEHPQGDPARTHGWNREGHGLWWKVISRNKRTVTLDLGQPEGADLLRRLAGQADVLVENFRPGVMERWGLGPDDLLAVNPRLVMLRVTGFGQTGPYATRRAFGTLMEAMSGVLAAAEIAALPGVRHLAMGGVDLARDLNAGSGNLQTLYVRSHLVVASRAVGIEPPIDSVYAQLDDERGLREQAEFARSLGFFGKSAIHPRQLPVLHEVFTPTAEQIAWAQEVLSAFEGAGGAAIRLPGGEFVDLPVAERARRLLDLAGVFAPI
jgi:hypothetical protein